VQSKKVKRSGATTATKKVATDNKKVQKNVKPTIVKQPKNVYLHTIGSDVNIRKGPCTNKQVLTTVPKNTDVTFIGQVKTGCGHTWFYVNSRFGKGWISSTYVKEGKASKSTPKRTNPSKKDVTMKGAYNCGQSYQSGRPTGNKQCIKINGKAVVVSTAQNFLKMKAAAAKAGITLYVNSGFRLQSEQQYLYNCYKTKKCNNGNLAARPGYSNHQNGLALDINVVSSKTYDWLRHNASKYGFIRTVPSETWHWEYRPGNRCNAMVSYSCQ
jgi:hypothetical protein